MVIKVVFYIFKRNILLSFWWKSCFFFTGLSLESAFLIFLITCDLVFLEFRSVKSLFLCSLTILLILDCVNQDFVFSSMREVSVFRISPISFLKIETFRVLNSYIISLWQIFYLFILDCVNFVNFIQIVTFRVLNDYIINLSQIFYYLLFL